MSAAAATLAGRRAAEALMVDTCRITRVTSRSTDPDTGATTDTTGQIYTGKCRLQQPPTQPQAQDVSGAYLYLLRMQLQLPIAAAAVQPEDVVEVTACVLDSQLVGRTFVIRGLARGTHKTARRLEIQEVT